MVADFIFQERFIVMQTLPNPLIGLCFLHRYNAVFDIRQGVLTFPEMSMQLEPQNSFHLRASTALLVDDRYEIHPQATITIVTKMPHLLDHDATGVLTPSPSFDDHNSIYIASSLSTVRDNSLTLEVTNVSSKSFTIYPDTHLANFAVMSPDQAKSIKPVDPGTLAFLMEMDNDENTIHYLNELLKVSDEEESSAERYWFPTPENPGDPSTYTPLQKRIYDELIELKELENLNPLRDEQSRDKFLGNFDWSDTTLNLDERRDIEEILVEFHDIFARHRFDVGVNNEFKIKLTPNNDKPAYSQSLPTPINLKDELTVELALLHKYDIITTLPYSNMLVRFSHKENQAVN